MQKIAYAGSTGHLLRLYKDNRIKKKSTMMGNTLNVHALAVASHLQPFADQ
jgi:hypothetical protein